MDSIALFLDKAKPYFKLILALGILVGISGFIYYAYNKAEDEMKKFNETKDEKTMSEEIAVDEYVLKEVDDENQLKWQLKAVRGVLEPKTRDVDLKGVEVEYYHEGKVSLKIIAPIGKANESTRKIQLTSTETEKVVGMGMEKQSRLETKDLELTKKNQFIATGGVNIDWPGVAKVTGDKAEGTMSPTRFVDHLIIRGNTHAQLSM